MMPAASDDLLPFDDDWRHIAMRAHIHHLCYSPVLRFSTKGITWLLTLRILRISKGYAWDGSHKTIDGKATSRAMVTPSAIKNGVTPRNTS